MSTIKYYPPLSEVVTVEDLPDALSFIKDGINSFFNSIYYKNLQYSKSAIGDTAFYSLDIISNKRLDTLDIELPGTGIFLIYHHSPLPYFVNGEYEKLE